jgi:hypothetical protein
MSDVIQSLLGRDEGLPWGGKYLKVKLTAGVRANP